MIAIGLVCTEADVRLQGGNNTQGRVEICNDNTWGTVCDDHWQAVDAVVVCTQLGLPSSGKIMFHVVSTCSASCLQLPLL